MGGGDIVVNDSAETWLEGLNVYGKSVQNSTTGAQLFNLFTKENKWVDNSFVVNGITFTVDNDGYLTIKGTSTGRAYVHLIYNGDKIHLDKGDYVVSLGASLPNGVSFLMGSYNTNGYEGNLVGFNEGISQKTFKVTTEIGYIDGYIEIKNAGVTVDYKCRPMLNKGTAPKPYEPFTGGQPSPNPNYLQPITSIGDKGNVDVNIYGKSLVPFAYKEIVTGSQQRMFDVPLPVGSYIVSFISAEGTPPSNDTYAIGVQFEKNSVANNISVHINRNTKFAKFTVNRPIEGIWLYSDFGYKPSIDKTTVFEGLMIRPVNTSDDYESYKSIQSLGIDTPNGLNGIKVASDGNYIDTNGQQWNTDKVNFGNGKVIKRVDKLVIDGTNIKFTETENMWWNLPHGCCKGANSADAVLSNLTNTFRINTTFEFPFLTKTNMSNYFTTVDELNNYCVRKYNEGNPIVVYYCINPIETSISVEEMRAYKVLHTNYPTTVITNDSKASMDLHYVANTKNYIESKVLKWK